MYLREAALLSSSTRDSLRRRSTSRFTGVTSRGSMEATVVARLVTASSSASSRPVHESKSELCPIIWNMYKRWVPEVCRASQWALCDFKPQTL